MYTTKEAADVLSVTPQSIRRYTKLSENPLKASQVGLRSSLRIREDDLIEFAKHHKMSIIELQEQVQ